MLRIAQLVLGTVGYAIAIASVLLWAGCATRSPDHVTVKWVRVGQDEIHRVCAQRQGHNPTVIGRNRACAIYNRDAGFCTIWASDFIDVRDRELMASLGHELKHCFDGPWH